MKDEIKELLNKILKHHELTETDKFNIRNLITLIFLYKEGKSKSDNCNMKCILIDTTKEVLPFIPVPALDGGNSIERVNIARINLMEAYRLLDKELADMLYIRPMAQ